MVGRDSVRTRSPMDALELLKSRASIPSVSLGEPGPSEAEITEILTIASRVPDHGKLVPWRFILYRGDGRTLLGERLAEIHRRKEPGLPGAVYEQDRMRFANAPLVIGVISRAAPHVKIPEWEQVLSSANAAFSIVLAAHALGFTAQWLTSWAAYDEEAKAALGVKPEEKVTAFVHIGTPKVPRFERPRPALADIVTEWEP
ncbi:MAG: nitroreductase [Bauldia sp.]|nr:nitroreductase [Bauldia sp.]